MLILVTMIYLYLCGTLHFLERFQRLYPFFCLPQIKVVEVEGQGLKAGFIMY